MPKPLVVDLFCGRGGWSKGFMAAGWDAIGFDIERHSVYPGQLVLQDVLTLHGSQFRFADAIAASPPCQEPSYRAMPWKRAKALNAAGPPHKFIELFETCFRLQREACEASGWYIPMILENVKGAQPWVGSARWHFGSYYLWGDVPALMPITKVLKQPGRDFHFQEKYGIPSPLFHGADHEASVKRALALKTIGHANIRDRFDHTRHLTNQRESDAVKGNGTWFGQSHGREYEGQPGNPVNHTGTKVSGMSFNGYGTPGYKPQGFNVTAAQRYRDGVKQEGLSGEAWFNEGMVAKSSRSDSRKAASALIAEIPFDLAYWIAECFRP